MKKVIGFLAIAVMLSFGTVVLTYAADPMGAPSAATAKTVKGELLMQARFLSVLLLHHVELTFNLEELSLHGLGSGR